MTNHHQKHWRLCRDESFNETDLPVWGYYPDRNPSVRFIDFMGNQMTHWMPAKDLIPPPPISPVALPANVDEVVMVSNDSKRLDWLAKHGPVSWGYTGGSRAGEGLRGDIDEAMARDNLHAT